MEFINGIVRLTDVENEKLKLINPGKIERIRIISNSEESSLRNILGKNGVHYHQTIWKLTGKINTATIMRGYKKMVAENVIFRTNYVLDLFGSGLAVTYEVNENCNFPITDISESDSQTTIRKIASVAAAEARRTYNPQKSPAIRLQGFIMDNNYFAVVVSFIPELCKNLTRENIGKYLFPMMKYTDGAFNTVSSSVGNLNDKISQQNVDYWKRELDEKGSELNVPGESMTGRNTPGIGSSYKKLNDNLFDKVCEFAKENKVSTKAVYIYAWMKMFASFNGQNEISLAMVGNYDEPSVYPVNANIDQNEKKLLNTIEEKLNNASKYGFMKDDDYSKIFNDLFFEHYHIQFYFLDMDSIYEKDNWLFVNNDYFDNGIDLTVRVNYSHSGAFFNYIYSNSKYINEGIDTLNKSYEDILKSMFFDGSVSIDIEEFDKTVKTEEEIRQEQFESKIRCLKDINLLECCDSTEIADIAKDSFIQHVTVDEELLREGEVADYVGIVVSGQIEESATDSKGLGRSLRILSKDAIFGGETLLEKNFYKRTYTVASSEAVIVWVPKATIESIMRKEPEVWKKILEIVYERLWKMESIWLME